MSKQDPRASVLVIDDDPGLCRLLERILAKDFEVDVATNGRVARRRVKERDYSLVLLDRSLPDVPGLTMVRFLRQAMPAARIVFFTGHRITADENGLVDAWIQKPTGPSEIKQVIALMLDGPRLPDQS